MRMKLSTQEKRNITISIRLNCLENEMMTRLAKATHRSKSNMIIKLAEMAYEQTFGVNPYMELGYMLDPENEEDDFFDDED